MTNSIKVTWIVDGDVHLSAQVPIGRTLMEAAVGAGVPGIRGECGGALACATCHVVVEHTPAELEEPERSELEMLEFADVPPRPASRLSCQLRALRALDGIVFRVPKP